MTCMMLRSKPFSSTMTIFEARSSALTAPRLLYLYFCTVEVKVFSYVPSQIGRSVSILRVGYTLVQNDKSSFRLGLYG